MKDRAPFFAVGFLVEALAVGLWFWSKSDKPNNDKEIFYKREIERIKLDNKRIESRENLWANHAQKLSDSIKMQNHQTKLYEIKIRVLLRSVFNIRTDAQLDSAIDKVIGYN